MMAIANQDDCFKEEFKRYKKKKPGVHLKNVIDFRQPEKFKKEISLLPVSDSSASGCPCRLGLRPTREWDMYALPSVPGLLVIPNPFLTGGQHRWVWQCLVTYPCRPNICNLDAHMERRGSGQLWSHLPPSYTSDDESDQKRSTDAECLSTAKKLKLSKEHTVLIKDSPIYKLRWVTLGYHYDWTTKEYCSDRRSPFPDDLAQLSQFILRVAGFHEFLAEAGIVNYYHLDSTLSGHTDHSEKDLSCPLLSISFAQSAIFLVGGKTKDICPKALLLNSGDVIIMSGDSRLAYHGIPKVLAPAGDDEAIPACLLMETLAQNPLHDRVCAECKRHECSFKEDPSHQQLMDSWTHFIPYLSLSRINVNVRQVVSASCKF